jgi:hypothetical protein
VGTLPGILASTGVATPVAATGAAAGGMMVATVAIPAAAAYCVGKDADTIIETTRLYEGQDKAFKPDHDRHSNLATELSKLKPQLMKEGLKFDKKGRLDMMQPAAVYKVQKVLAEEYVRLGGVMDENRSMLPRQIVITKKQGEMRYNYEDANQDRRMAGSALVELDDVRQNVKKLKQHLAQAHHVGDGHAHHGLAHHAPKGKGGVLEQG